MPIRRKLRERLSIGHEEVAMVSYKDMSILHLTLLIKSMFYPFRSLLKAEVLI